MWDTFRRREVLEGLFVLGLGGLAADSATAGGGDDGHHEAGEPTLNRLATTTTGAEFTGLYLTERGDLFFNVQHPSETSLKPYDHGAVGVLAGFNVNDLPRDFPSVQLPKNDVQEQTVRTAVGFHQALANGGDPLIDDPTTERNEAEPDPENDPVEFGPGGERLGIPYTTDGEPLTDANNPDFNGFVVSDDAWDEGYLFTNWETTPGAMSRLHIELSEDGTHWDVVGSMNVDFRDVEGTWINCFGTVSPWGTPLTSEENYDIPNTANWNDPEDPVGGVEDLARYMGYEPNDDGVFDEEYPNPFRQGYIVEITEPRSADPTPKKRFALGRSTHENAVVMPDERTAYTTSDGTGQAFFKFVADEAGDLSAGTLYAAKADQERGNDVNTVGFDLKWLELGHATEDEIESWIAEYDDVTQADYTEGETSYIPDEEVRAWADGDADDDRVAFLTSNRAAEAIGATAEFRKMEGVNISHDAEPGDYMYVAMSAVNATMADGEGDIRLRGNDYGTVYRMQLEEGYDVSHMEPAVTGGPDANVCGGCPYDADPNSASEVCQDCSFNPGNGTDSGLPGTSLLSEHAVDTENTMANPDNVLVMDDGRVIIGEDSGLHDNNMLWVYDPGETV